jgi:hypothetical protein
MLGAQGLWAGRYFYRVAPAVTRGLGFSGLIRRTAPFSRLLWLTKGCGGSILTRLLKGKKKETIEIPMSLSVSSLSRLKNWSYVEYALAYRISWDIYIHTPWRCAGDSGMLLHIHGKLTIADIPLYTMSIDGYRQVHNVSHWSFKSPVQSIYDGLFTHYIFNERDKPVWTGVAPPPFF